MTALASTDVTVAVTERWWEGLKLHSRGTITFGDGALTYVTTGVPLPAIAKFSMRRALDVLDVFGVNGLTTDYMPPYNATAHALLMYEEEAPAAGGPLLEADTSEAPAARVYGFHAIGS